MDTKINAIHVNPKNKLYMNNLVKNRKSEEKKNQSFFKKTKQFNVETLQSIVFYEWNAWVWDENFSKTLEFNPDLPKTSFSIKLSKKKTQTLSTFCIKIKEILILDDHNKITHNIMYKV